MIRITFEGADLSDFQSTEKPDEFVYLLFPPTGASKAILPARSKVGSDDWNYPAGVSEPPGRYYTIRKWDDDRRELVIDFAVHDGGVGGTWAAGAQVGDPLGIRRPTARFNIPADCEWVLLLADFTGLPAVGRIVEEMPASQKIVAHVEIPSSDDRQSLKCPCELSLHWHATFGQSGCATQLLNIARSVELPEGHGYIWIAGEAKAVSDSRKHFRDVVGVDKDRITSVGYWIEGQARG